MSDSGGDIIIKGGSVDLSFDEATYPRTTADPKSHKNPNQKITQVTIEGGGLSYDSGDHPSGLTCTIKVTCK